MRPFNMFKVVVLVAASMALAASPATAQLLVPWNFYYEGLAFTTPDGFFFAEGTGYSYYLGETYVEAASAEGTPIDIDPVTNIGHVVGDFTMESTDGKQAIYGRIDEYIFFDSIDGNGDVISIIFHTVTGGKGKFKKAYGYGVAYGATNLITGQFDYSGSGLISPPKK